MTTARQLQIIKSAVEDPAGILPARIDVVLAACAWYDMNQLANTSQIYEAHAVAAEIRLERFIRAYKAAIKRREKLNGTQTS